MGIVSLPVARWTWRWAPVLRLAAVLLPVFAGAPKVRAQSPDDWVLDAFYVVYSREDVEVRRETVPAAGTREFDWHGRQDFSADYPNGSIVLDANIRLVLPDRIRPGNPFTVSAEGTGTINTPGRSPDSTDYSALLNMDVKCYDPSLCNLGNHQFAKLVPRQKVDLAVTIPPKSVTMPTDPGQYPVSSVLYVHGGIGTTMPNDDYWTVDIGVYYKRPEPASAWSLSLDADNPRLPPSGRTVSTSTLTATVRDPGGNPGAGDALAFRLDPPDLGRLSAASSVTDARGEARIVYTAPDVDVLGDRGEVTVWVSNATRALERAFTFHLQRYGLQIAADPPELQVADPPPTAKVRATVRGFDGRPVAGDLVAFSLNPADAGTVSPEQATTNAQGVAEAVYTAPRPSTLHGVDRVTVYAANRTHGGEEGVEIRFKGLHVTATDPPNDARDVDWETLRAIAINFDQRVNDLTIGGGNVKVETVNHGSLGAELDVQGHALVIRLTQQPIPDVGLQVRVTIRGGEHGVRGMDGSLLLADYALRFRTMPRLKPELIVSQTVDDAHDRAFDDVRSIVRKPFAVRIAAGIPEDSELDDETVEVTLVGPYEENKEKRTHVYYPGRWPPLVPEDAARRGNTANFVIRQPPLIGQYGFRADLHPVGAPADKVFTVFADNINMVRFNTGRDTVKGVLVVPLVNNLIPGYAWRTSRGGQLAWLTQRAADAGAYLPTERVAGILGYLDDSTCLGSSGNIDCIDRAPWTHFQSWVRQLGRAGMFTRFSYIVGLVPEGWFSTLEEHPDVVAHPNQYHDMAWSQIWSYRMTGTDGSVYAGAPVSLVEVGAPAAALVHAIAEAEGLTDSTAARDPIRGYDVATDRAMVTDGDHWSGAYLSAMNLALAHGPTWMATSDYQWLMDRWTARCVGRPPCRPEPATATRGLVDTAAAPVRVVGISGAIRIDGATEQATLDPLIFADGVPTLGAGDAGPYALELRDATGAVTARYPFDPAFAPAGDGSVAGFFVRVPWDAAAAAVALTHAGRDLVVARRSAAPVVGFTAPTAGGRYRGRFDIRWAATDTDGDRLTYTLLLSADAGVTWQPLLVDATATTFALDSTLVSNGANVRLRIVASDGFGTGEALLSLALDNPLVVLATDPPDGARGVGVGTTVLAQLRDPLDPATVSDRLLRLRDGSGSEVIGRVTYDSTDGSVLFTPDTPLAEGRRYEAHLAGARTPDGRALPADVVWSFVTRGIQAYLPWAGQSGNARPITPTPWPTAPVRATRTGTPDVTRQPVASPTPTGDDIATRVAATLTALAPAPSNTPRVPPTPTATASATASPTPTADDLATRVAATLTALAPAPSASPSPSATATPDPGMPPVAVDGVFISSLDPKLRRTVFVAGDAITLWLHVVNAGPAAARPVVDFTVVGHAGYSADRLSWSGEVEVPPGPSWLHLDRTVPGDLPGGPYTFLASLGGSGDAGTLTSELYVASRLLRADDFADVGSGWPVEETTTAGWGYFDGEFRIRVKADDWWARITPGTAASDCALEVDARALGAMPGATALLFGLNARGDEFGIFEVFADGTFGVFRRVAGGWQTLRSAAPSAALATGDQTNHLALVRRGAALALYANGKLLDSATDTTTEARWLGVYTWGQRAGFDGRFDNWRAYAVPAPVALGTAGRPSPVVNWRP
jgi:hypothetical protein